MKCHVAKADLETRKKRRKRRFIIPYEVAEEQDPDVEVDGDDISRIRKEAGYGSQWRFAEACGWHQNQQCWYEKNGKKRMKLSKILKMIRVCNGSE